jgi:hypothetical protein
VYAVEQWGRLAARCRDGGQTVILESTFLQNSVMPPFLNGAPADTAVARVHGARSAAWTDWNMASVAAFPLGAEP